MIQDVYETTGINATAGIGSNMYLAKVAMDIVAKHVKANEQGVRIATSDEMTYRKLLWEHKPLTDFWRIGKGISKKLEDNGIFTMGDIALTSIENENKLFKLFGVNAELLIDHAWGYEPCTISDVKKYKPKNTSISSGQVLHEPYSYAEKVAIQSALIVGSGFYHHEKHKYFPGYYPHFHVPKKTSYMVLLNYIKEGFYEICKEND